MMPNDDSDPGDPPIGAADDRRIGIREPQRCKVNMQSQPQVIERRRRPKADGEENAKLQRLVQELRTCEGGRFTGYIKINYSQGTIARVEKFEEILKK